MAAYDEEEDDEPDGEEMHFDCPCGRSLTVPLAMTGSIIECPWCLKEVRVPGGAEDGAPVEGDSPAEAPSDKDLSRCPSCAAFCEEEECPSCRVVPLPASDWEILPYAEDQEVVSPASADWILRRARWVLSKQTRAEFFARPLLLPTEEFFPGRWEGKREQLEEVLVLMQRHSGLAECPVKLSFYDLGTGISEALAQQGILIPTSGFAGCIYAPQMKDGVARIILATSQFADRIALVGTLGHELGHLFGFVRLGCIEAPPSDNEPLTDLISVLHGSGVFTCESAHQVRNWGRATNQGVMTGWTTTLLGYLSQPEFSFALALFCALREVPVATVAAHLSLNPRTMVKDTLRFLESTPAAVREVASVLR